MMLIFDELKNDFNAFLRNNALWISLVLLGFVIAALVVIIIFNRKVKKAQAPKIAEKSRWVEALGGSENITSSEAMGSRLVVTLEDKTKMNKDALKELGVTNFIEMSNKVTLLLEDKAELVKKELDK